MNAWLVLLLLPQSINVFYLQLFESMNDAMFLTGTVCHRTAKTFSLLINLLTIYLTIQLIIWLINGLKYNEKCQSQFLQHLIPL